MAVTARNASVDLAVGAVWLIDVSVTDVDGCPAAAATTVTITLPDDTTEEPAVTDAGAGRYRAEYVLTAAGRHIAEVETDGYGVAGLVAYAHPITTAAGMPTVASVRTYDPDTLTSWGDPAVQDALDAEAAAQRSVCEVGAAYPDDLREALSRRVVVNLTRRGIRDGIVPNTGGDGSPSAYLASNDAEVRRLERSHRRLPTG